MDVSLSQIVLVFGNNATAFTLVHAHSYLSHTHGLMPRTLIPFAHARTHTRSHHNHVLTIITNVRTHVHNAAPTFAPVHTRT